MDPYCLYFYLDVIPAFRAAAETGGLPWSAQVLDWFPLAGATLSQWQVALCPGGW